jgi:uncharacterized repeat protein (TIGR03843 family)
VSAEPTPGVVPGIPPQPTDEVREALAEGELELQGRIMPASNATFFGESVLGAVRIPCVYKPVAGERPLWDFPTGTLAHRERAAYLVSEALGWDVVPLTILREGPHGRGMVQVWCEPERADDHLDAVDLCPVDEVPEGYLHILDATDGSGNDVALVHEDSPALHRMAVFDALVNNADRKGGHVLPMTGGHRYGVDHGVCFHVEDKLRTVLWGWAGDRLDAEDCRAVAALGERLRNPEADPGATGSGAGLAEALAELLDADEVAMLARRCLALARRGRMPVPSGSWPSIPWPAF